MNSFPGKKFSPSDVSHPLRSEYGLHALFSFVEFSGDFLWVLFGFSSSAQNVHTYVIFESYVLFLGLQKHPKWFHSKIILDQQNYKLL